MRPTRSVAGSDCPLLRLLARGRPVSVDDLVDVTGGPVERAEPIRRTLAGHTDIEYDDRDA